MSWVTKTTAKPISRCSSLICVISERCATTSSAEVGSSMITRSGVNSRAIAIIARCRIPPDSWCGKLFRCTASIPTSRSTSADLAAMAFREVIPCVRSTSAYCAPTDMTGLSAFIADCMTTDRFCQRIALSRRPVIVTRSWPRNVTEPAVMAAGGESNWAIANSSVDLPHPDSPTMPTNSPDATLNDTSSTACTGFLPAYSTVRPDTSSIGKPPEDSQAHAAARPHWTQRRVADLVECVVEQRERRAEQPDGRAGHDRLQVVAGLQCLVILRPVEHRAPGDRVRVTEADEPQA